MEKELDGWTDGQTIAIDDQMNGLIGGKKGWVDG